MTKHPRQREMWEGLSGPGCLSLLILIVIVSLIGAM